jgi:hypothetical protein
MCNYFYPRRAKNVGNRDNFVHAVKLDISLIAQLYEIQNYRTALPVNLLYRFPPQTVNTCEKYEQKLIYILPYSMTVTPQSHLAQACWTNCYKKS